MQNLLSWPYYTTEFLASQGLSPTFVKRFWSKVQVTDGCWLWTASTIGGKWPYGKIGRWKEYDAPMGAHVASWILHYGPVPAGKWICHNCDNPPCVRPDHLFPGNAEENTHDMIDKGRAKFPWRDKPPRGPLNINNVLTREQVDEIRRLYIRGHPDYCQRALAEKFGCSQTLISAIVLNKIWNY